MLLYRIIFIYWLIIEMLAKSHISVPYFFVTIFCVGVTLTSPERLKQFLFCYALKLERVVDKEKEILTIPSVVQCIILRYVQWNWTLAIEDTRQYKLKLAIQHVFQYCTHALKWYKHTGGIHHLVIAC